MNRVFPDSTHKLLPADFFPVFLHPDFCTEFHQSAYIISSLQNKQLSPAM